MTASSSSPSPGPTLLPTAEQDELRAVVRDLVARHADSRRAAVEHGGCDHAAWRLLVDQVGVTGLAVPEDRGGLGFGWGELSVVLEEVGYGLLPVPTLSSAVLATGALLAVDGSDDVDAVLKRLVGGARGALALPLGLPADELELVANGDVLEGTALVLEAADAEVLLAVARDGDRIGLYLLDLDDTAVTPADGVDLVRRVAHVTPGGRPVARLGTLTELALAAVREQGRLALACEQVGGARACLDLAVAYARQRTQFDRPIGSFQAIKHQLADVFVGVEAATAALAEGVRVAVERPGSLGDAAQVATATAGTAFHDAAEATIHVHGGIGFTWEHDAHLYYRRAVAANAMFGHPDELDRARGAGLVG